MKPDHRARFSEVARPRRRTYNRPMLRLVLLLWCTAAPAFAQAFQPLKTVAVPPVPELDRYVRDRAALLVLGKALFWDMQVGSDGRTACATCHFHAGADHRAQNQLSN